MSERHVALIVEDDPHIAEILKELVTSLGHDWVHATTLDEVRAAVAAGGYCYVLLDMQIPADATSRPSVGCGETALRLIRRASPDRTASGRHVLPILVVTGYSRDPDFVSKMYDMDANGFIAKPFGERVDLELDKIRAALVRAEREEHEGCGGDAKEELPTPPENPCASASVTTARVVRIAIEGRRVAGRNDVLVDGRRGSLPDVLFCVFLRFVGSHLGTPGAWQSAAKLGMARNRWAPTRIRAALRDVLPSGVEILESERNVGYRLNAAVHVERVEWGELAKHPQAAVRKVAEEWKGWGEGKRTES